MISEYKDCWYKIVIKFIAQEIFCYFFNTQSRTTKNYFPDDDTPSKSSPRKKLPAINAPDIQFRDPCLLWKLHQPAELSHQISGLINFDPDDPIARPCFK